jgi:hypothetical protein
VWLPTVSQQLREERSACVSATSTHTEIRVAHAHRTSDRTALPAITLTVLVDAPCQRPFPRRLLLEQPPLALGGLLACANKCPRAPGLTLPAHADFTLHTQSNRTSTCRCPPTLLPPFTPPAQPPRNPPYQSPRHQTQIQWICSTHTTRKSRLVRFRRPFDQRSRSQHTQSPTHARV